MPPMTSAVPLTHSGENVSLPYEAGWTRNAACNGRFPMRTGASLDNERFALLRRRAVLQGCKWDPQVGDVSTLASFPLVISRREWRQLVRWAEQLTIETLAAEAEILEKPQLIDGLGLPRKLRHVLKSREVLTPAALRVMRFDFHFTTEGWRLSEVNSDVPGGFSEASFFTALVAEKFPQFTPAGDPAAAWADAIVRVANGRGVVAMLAAPGYLEDQQIMVYLAGRLRERGCIACLANPTQVDWKNGAARLEVSQYSGPIGALVRFYQGEWFARLPKRFGWENFFRGGRAPVANPGVAVLSESKRFPCRCGEPYCRRHATRAMRRGPVTARGC